MFILKRITLIIRYAECPNFEVANPINPALTSCETTLMVSVLEVEVKLNLPIVNPISNLLRYVQVISDLLGQLVTSPMKLSTLLQDANNLFQICRTTGNKRCDLILISAWWTDLVQLACRPSNHPKCDLMLSFQPDFCKSMLETFGI